MKRQVVFEIMDDLAIAKEKTKSNQKRAAFEESIRIVLKRADILDLRPAHKRR